MGEGVGGQRVILITGASAGIGRATALAFAQVGATVAATARREDKLQALQAEAQSLHMPGQIIPAVADVTDPIALQCVVDDVMNRFGRLDVLVANAGLGQRGAIADAAWDDLETVLRTNIDGVLHSVRVAVPAMRACKALTGGGRIILLGSVVSIAVTPYATTYAMTKAALNALARGLRLELAADGIWVTNLLVGQTHTEFAAARRGTPGKVSGLPTMRAEYVAARIVREASRRRRTVTLRWFDRLVVAGGVFMPRLVDALAARLYKSRTKTPPTHDLS
jgi:short-subunit dehydrogenase